MVITGLQKLGNYAHLIVGVMVREHNIRNRNTTETIIIFYEMKAH